MDWSTVVKYGMEFIKWAWDNKFVVVFAITTLIFAIMYGCEKRNVEALTEKLDKAKTEIVNYKKEIATYEQDIVKLTKVNSNMKLSYEACKEELEVSKKSFAKAKEIQEAIDKEISKYKDLAKQIDSEKDEAKQMELKKKLLEELFKGKKAIKLKTSK